MDKHFLEQYEKKRETFEAFLREFWVHRHSDEPGALQGLDVAIDYSLLQSGAKRFRPVVGLLTEEMLTGQAGKFMAFATAIEMVHCFSLIHDDLPCMDDDDERRGQPTNHIKFGEPIALLAGDALLSEAFGAIAYSYSDAPELAIQLVRLLAGAVGKDGMIGGQVIDMKSKMRDMSVEALHDMHARKTGALIRVAVEGACVVSSASEDDTKALQKYGDCLGLAFQLADDLLDAAEEKAKGEVSFVTCLGEEKTKSYLKEVTDAGLSELTRFGDRAGSLAALSQYNCDRTF